VPAVGEDLSEEQLIAVCRRLTKLSDRVLCFGGCCKASDVENAVVNTVINLSRRDVDIPANRISRLGFALRHQLITRGHDKTSNHQIGPKSYQPTFKVTFPHDLHQTRIVQNSRISDQQFQAGQFPAS
jgi:hypothetical protein